LAPELAEAPGRADALKQSLEADVTASVFMDQAWPIAIASYLSSEGVHGKIRVSSDATEDWRRDTFAAALYGCESAALLALRTMTVSELKEVGKVMWREGAQLHKENLRAYFSSDPSGRAALRGLSHHDAHFRAAAAEYLKSNGSPSAGRLAGRLEKSTAFTVGELPFWSPLLGPALARFREYWHQKKNTPIGPTPP
jgi:hypothetical protein